MAKLTLVLLAVIAAALVLVADASIHKVVTSTEVVEEDNQGSISQRCREQLRRVNPESCERYMTRSTMLGLEEDDEEINPGRGGQEELQRCCQQLQRMEDEQCQCQALQHLMMRHQGEFQGQEMREMLDRARRIPQFCGMRGCRMSQPW